MKCLALPLCLALLALPAPGHTRLVSTDSVIAAENMVRERARVGAFLDREDVRSQLSTFGVDAEEARARLDTLSDAEVQQLAARVDSMPAGQNTVGIIVGAALTIFIILLITDLLGLTHVFPFT